MTTCIAEIGGNHRGEFQTALRMIEIIAHYCTEHFSLDGDCPKPYVKFQKRTCGLELYPEWAHPHPNHAHAFGDSYLEHRQALEFSASQHGQLMAECRFQGVGYACSVWDIPAADDIIPLAPDWIKIPSACNQDFELIEHILSRYPGDLHISLGMTSREEVYDLANSLGDDIGRTVFYACTSNYPCRMDDVCLRELDVLRREFVAMRGLKAAGFSGHHNGIAVDMAAVALGASYLERHFTLNRTWKGTDQAASLEPDGFRRLMRDANAVVKALGMKPEDGILACERSQRAKLKRKAVAA